MKVISAIFDDVGKEKSLEPVFKGKINQGSLLRDKKDVEGGKGEEWMYRPSQWYKINSVLQRCDGALQSLRLSYFYFISLNITQ